MVVNSILKLAVLCSLGRGLIGSGSSCTNVALDSYSAILLLSTLALSLFFDWINWLLHHSHIFLHNLPPAFIHTHVFILIESGPFGVAHIWAIPEKVLSLAFALGSCQITYQRFRRQQWQGRGIPRSRTQWTDPNSRQSNQPLTLFCSLAGRRRSFELKWKSGRCENWVKVSVKVKNVGNHPQECICSQIGEKKSLKKKLFPVSKLEN